MKKGNAAYVLLTSVFIILLLVFSFYAVLTKAYTWLYDFGTGIIIILLLHHFRKKLHLSPALFGLLGIGLFLHYIGVFGAYTWQFAGWEYDNLPHLYTPFIITLILLNYLKRMYDFSTITLVFFTIFIIMGIAAFHEIIEYLGYRILGQGDGMFFYGAGDFGNSSSYDNALTDMINNLIGGITGCLVSLMKKLKMYFSSITFE